MSYAKAIDEHVIGGDMSRDDMGLDAIAAKIGQLGIPGLVLIVAMWMTGLAGAAAFVTALAALGGPFGMWGGLIVMGLLVTVSNGLSRFGLKSLFQAVLSQLYKQGKTKDEILLQISKYPITAKMKKALVSHINRINNGVSVPETSAKGDKA